MNCSSGENLNFRELVGVDVKLLYFTLKFFRGAMFMIYGFVFILIAFHIRNSINLVMQHSKWTRARTATFQVACWTTGGKSTTSHFAPFFQLKHLDGKVLDDTGEGFADVIKLYFALQE